MLHRRIGRTRVIDPVTDPNVVHLQELEGLENLEVRRKIEQLTSIESEKKEKLEHQNRVKKLLFSFELLRKAQL
jgi:hypothetical protein